ncbi:MAG: SLC13 family permease [Nitrososphaerales archaeon]
MIYLVIAIFVLTYLLLIFRRIRGREIPVWVSMIVGAVLMLLTLSISPIDAFRSESFQVIGFLFGMLVLTVGFEKSGLIEYMVLMILRRARKIDHLLLGIIFGSAFLSALLVNDTVALLWTPIVIGIASKIGLKQNKALLLPLAFGITIGSSMTPIGNPQNLLVALDSGMARPFSDFLAHLFLPTIVSLFATYYVCRSRLFFARFFEGIDLQKSYSAAQLQNPKSAISDTGLAKLSASLMVALLLSFGIVEAFPSLQTLGLTLSNLALSFGVILLLASGRREYLLVNLSWGILLFFAGMFVVMGAVWDSGIGRILLDSLPAPILGNTLQSTGAIMSVSILLSQVLSNVPFVQLYSYQMANLGFAGTVVPWLALAAGATLAGNLTLLGAVSNVIIVDAAEKRGDHTFGFLEFFKFGSVITFLTALIFYFFLVFV